jgi:anti-sigma factor RsiW
MNDHLSDELSGLLDGELSTTEAAAAHAHLAVCAFCTAELAAFERTRSLVRSLPMVEPRRAFVLAEPAPRRWSASLAPVAAIAASIFVLAVQWAAPAGRSITPQLAGLVQNHAQVEGQAVSAHRLRAGGVVHTPVTLSGQYRWVATYQRGHVVHTVYSDGVHTLSVFAEAGDLAEDELPEGATLVDLGSKQARHYALPRGDVLLWEADGIVYTAVADVPSDDVTAAAGSMPGARKLGFTDRLRRTCRSLVETVTGGP